MYVVSTNLQFFARLRRYSKFCTFAHKLCTGGKWQLRAQSTVLEVFETNRSLKQTKLPHKRNFDTVFRNSTSTQYFKTEYPDTAAPPSGADKASYSQYQSKTAPRSVADKGSYNQYPDIVAPRSGADKTSNNCCVRVLVVRRLISPA